MQIEVTVKNDQDEIVGTYHATNAYPATMVTVALWDGDPVVTDEKSNTYYRWER
jgi:hypothetical protein